MKILDVNSRLKTFVTLTSRNEKDSAQRDKQPQCIPQTNWPLLVLLRMVRRARFWRSIAHRLASYYRGLCIKLSQNNWLWVRLLRPVEKFSLVFVDLVLNELFWSFLDISFCASNVVLHDSIESSNGELCQRNCVLPWSNSQSDAPSYVTEQYHWCRQMSSDEDIPSRLAKQFLDGGVNWARESRETLQMPVQPLPPPCKWLLPANAQMRNIPVTFIDIPQSVLAK